MCKTGIKGVVRSSFDPLKNSKLSELESFNKIAENARFASVSLEAFDCLYIFEHMGKDYSRTIQGL